MNCKITILDETDKCPLCRQILEDDGKENRDMYPDARVVSRRFRLAENIFLFASIVAEVILIYISTLTDLSLAVCMIVGLALLYANVILKLTILGRSSYVFKIVSLVVSAVIILWIIDNLSGYRGWSLNFSMPAVIILMDIAIILMMIINNRNWQSYMMLQLFTLLMSGISFILLLVGIIDFPYLTMVATGVSLFLFLGTVIIGDQRARNELKRRFHV